MRTWPKTVLFARCLTGGFQSIFRAPSKTIHEQSIEMAAQYYACYAQAVGFKNTATTENAKSCPDFQQYVGKIVNDVESVIVIGAYRFSSNSSLTMLDQAAKAEITREDALDTIRFGRWVN